jgi:hypothetical protein
MKKLLFAALGIFLSLSFTITPAQADYINLAPVYGTATANSVYYGGPNEVYSPPYTPDRAIDGNLTTQWNAGSWPNASAPLWLIVNLHNIFDVDRIVLNSADTYYSDYYFEGYNLYIGNDGENWTFVQSGNLVDNAILYRAEISLEANMQNIQYVKLELPVGTHWGHLNEIQIYGNTASVPEPTTMLLLGFGLIGLAGVRRLRT